IASLSGVSTLAAASAAGASSITATQFVSPGEVLSIGAGAATEQALVLSTSPAPGAQFTLALATPLQDAHSSGDRIDAVGSLGVGKSVTIQGDTNGAFPTVSSPLVVWQGTNGVTLETLNF